MSVILNVDKRRIRQIERDIKRGVPPKNVTQAELDALHGVPCEENLAWWSAERKKADDADDMQRWRMCDSARRTMLLCTVPHANDTDGEMDQILERTLSEFEGLPQLH